MVSSYCWKSCHFRNLKEARIRGIPFPCFHVQESAVTAVTRSVTAAQSRQLIPGSKRAVRKFPRPEKQRLPFFYMPDKRMANERG
jgi:hypothetical protein